MFLWNIRTQKKRFMYLSEMFCPHFVVQRDSRCKGIHSKVKPISVSALMRPFDVINCRALIDLLPDAGNNNDMADSHQWRRTCYILDFNSCLLYLHKSFSSRDCTGVSLIRFVHLLRILQWSFTFADKVSRQGVFLIYCAAACGVL